MPTISLPIITNDGQGASRFSTREIELSGEMTKLLSEPMSAVDFRFRESHAYASDFHCAGDPTLLIILSGCIRIELQNGETQEFRAGDFYIAEDWLEAGVTFDASIHGHRAEQIGDAPYRAVHIKLSHR